MSDGSEQVRVLIDPEACIAGGQCELLESETFRVDDDTAVAAVIGTGMLPRNRAEIVVDRCPGGAISIIDQDEST